MALFESAAAKSGLDRGRPRNLTLPIPESMEGKKDTGSDIPGDWQTMADQIIQAALTSPQGKPEEATNGVENEEVQGLERLIEITSVPGQNPGFCAVQGRSR